MKVVERSSKEGFRAMATRTRTQNESSRRTNSETANDAAATDAHLDDWDMLLELGLEHAKVIGTAERTDTVGVGQERKDADVGVVLELRTNCHDDDEVDS